MTSHGEPTRTAFVASPIGAPGTEINKKATLALDYVIRKALAAPQWAVVRADDESSPDSISQRVLARIAQSDLIVVDFTDRNPNVFYELAVAHCFKKPVVQIATEGTVVPFDVADQRTIFYDLTDPASVDAATTKLRSAAEFVLANPDTMVTPLTTFEAITVSSEKLTAGDQGELLLVMEGIAARLSAIENTVSSVRTSGDGLPEPASIIHHRYVRLIERGAEIEGERRHLASVVQRYEDLASGNTGITAEQMHDMKKRAQRLEGLTEELAEPDREIDLLRGQLLSFRMQAPPRDPNSFV